MSAATVSPASISIGPSDFRFMPSRNQYRDAVIAAVDRRPAEAPVDPDAINEEVALLLGVRPANVREHLKDFVTADRRLWGRIIGVYPRPAAVIAAVESDMGTRINGANLSAANRIAKGIIDAITRPSVRHFVLRNLAPHIQGTVLSMPVDELVDFLLADYSDHLVRIKNGLVSIAGTLNQSLLVQALRNGGLSDRADPKQFQETGTNTEGDIQIYYYRPDRANRTLHIEAKSYAARERLLRGLQDINPPKIGVGFFNDPREFNQDRTRLFIQAAQVQAIYMPMETFRLLSPEALELRMGASVLYRPLDRFVDDMIAFNREGELPDFAP